MNHKRSVVMGGALSALLLGASGAFAVGSGLFGSAAADNVGTFQAIEQAAVIRDTPPGPPASTTRPKASTSPSGAMQLTAPDSHPDDSAPGATEPSMGSTDPEGELHASEPRADDDDDSDEHGTTTTEPSSVDTSTTSTTHVEHEEEIEDDGRESDD